MDAEEIDAAAAAAELNILGGLASVTGLQSPAPTRPAGATANGASKDEASPIPSAPAAPSGVANDSPQGAVPATPSAVTITAEQLAMLGGIMGTAMKDAMGAAGALELAGNLPSFQDNIIHPTINIEELDSECALKNLVINEPLKVDAVKVILNNSFGMLGINSALIVQKFEN